MRETGRVQDLVGVVEAAYGVEASAEAWLTGVTEAVRPVLDLGDGVTGLLVDGRGAVPAPPRVVAVVGAGNIRPEAMQLHVQMSALSATVEARDRFLAAGAVGTLSRTAGPAFAMPGGVRDLLGTVGVGDVVYVLACPLDDLVCVLSANAAAPVRIPRHRSHVLERLAAHVASGCRLLGPRALAAPVEAVVDPGGRVQHAVGAARSAGGREALRRAALASERARGPLRRRDPLEALEAWRALVAGRWSLVDHFDSDGRRYLVARENQRQDRARRALAPREQQVAQLVAQGHSDKLIAYELGLSVGTVSTLVARARAKLGARSRIALIRLFQACPPEAQNDA